jgi:hypothetical protein
LKCFPLLRPGQGKTERVALGELADVAHEIGPESLEEDGWFGFDGVQKKIGVNQG